jgi:CheY-like chemotaxis protein
MLHVLREAPERKSVPAIAFFSHVEDEVRRTAVEAGCDEAMPRSRFVQELPVLLARAAARPSTAG